MSETERPRTETPLADLPTPDAESRRPMSWRAAALILAAALCVPALVARCVFSGRMSGLPTPLPTPQPAPPKEIARPSLDQIREVARTQGMAAALQQFERELVPGSPSPAEWMVYVLWAQDLGQADAAARGLDALRRLDTDPWLPAFLTARQLWRQDPRDLDGAAVELRAGVTAMRNLPELARMPDARETGPGWAVELLRDVVSALAAANRPREVAALLPERIAIEDPALALARLEALLADRRPEEVEAALESERWPVSEIDSRCLRIAARWASGRPQLAASLWDETWVAATTLTPSTEEALRLRQRLRALAAVAGDLERAGRNIRL